MESEFGELLKSKRIEDGMSLREFSKYLGISHAYLAKLEKGIDPRSGKKIEPTVEVLDKIASGLNISKQKLFEIAKKDVYKANLEDGMDVSKYFSDFIFEFRHQKKLYLGDKALNENDIELICNNLKDSFDKDLKQILNPHIK